MAKIFITHSYFLRFDAKQWENQQPYAPLATLYVASVLRNAGNEVFFYDVMFNETVEQMEKVLAQQQPDVFIICDDGFNYLTKMCLTNMRHAAYEMIGLAKKYACQVIISSSDSTDHSASYLDKGADFIVIGEAEQTMLLLVQAINDKQPIFNEIQGLRFLHNNQLISTPKRENLKDLDTLPMPAWDLVNIESYKQRWLAKKGYFSMNIGTTRGCPFKCNWCAKPIYGQRYNSRSPQHVISEIQYLQQQFGVQHIWFCDDIFGLKPKWTNEFSTLIKQELIIIRFKIQSRVDLLLEENNIVALAQAGCDEAWVGAESGSQKILDAMDKGTQVEQIYEATGLMKKFGIKPCFFLQFGYLNETYEDIKLTLKMVYELMPYDIGISVSYPLPGTKFYDMVKDQLKGKTNWTDSDELAMMFNSTYPGEFYKKLQRYVHSEYRKRKAIKAWQQHRDIKKVLSLLFRIPQTIKLKAQVLRYVKL
jgi:anaerobic magnesium-protoporphyrin IX monomethyl ester cyclase